MKILKNDDQTELGSIVEIVPRAFKIDINTTTTPEEMLEIGAALINYAYPRLQREEN